MSLIQIPCDFCCFTFITGITACFKTETFLQYFRIISSQLLIAHMGAFFRQPISVEIVNAHSTKCRLDDADFTLFHRNKNQGICFRIVPTVVFPFSLSVLFLIRVLSTFWDPELSFRLQKHQLQCVNSTPLKKNKSCTFKSYGKLSRVSTHNFVEVDINVKENSPVSTQTQFKGTWYSLIFQLDSVWK